jgi:hypothetical protein
MRSNRQFSFLSGCAAVWQVTTLIAAAYFHRTKPKPDLLRQRGILFGTFVNA